MWGGELSHSFGFITIGKHNKMSLQIARIARKCSKCHYSLLRQMAKSEIFIKINKRETDHFPLSFKESVELLPQFALQRGKFLKIGGIDLQNPQDRLAQIIRQPRDREWIHCIWALHQLPEFGWICCKCFQHCLQNPDPPKKGKCKHEVVQIGGDSHQLPMLHCELCCCPLV